MNVKICGQRKKKRKQKYREKIQTICFRHSDDDEKHKDFDEISVDKKGFCRVISRLRWNLKGNILYIV